MLAMPPRLTITRCAVGVAEQRRVKCRHQRRALPARRDVAAAEIGDDGEARALRDARGIVELQREAALGPVAQRLAVHARGHHARRGRASRRRAPWRSRRRRAPPACWRRDRARDSSFAPGVCSASSSSRSIVGNGMCAAPSVSQATPLAGAKSATTASTPSRLVPDITPAKRSPATMGISAPAAAVRRRRARRACACATASSSRQRGDGRVERRALLGRDRERGRQRDGHRIARLAGDAEFVVEMRAGRPPRLADVADRVALPHVRAAAQARREARQVRVDGRVRAAVPQHHDVAVAALAARPS